MTILNLQVSADADDGYYAGSWSATQNFLYVGNFTGPEDGGFRFLSATIPVGSTIDAADVQLFSEGGGGSPLLKIIGDDVDSCGALSSSHNPGSGWTDTTNQVDWDISWSTSGWKTSPDIKSVIQEIVDRGGWASGNNIGIGVNDDGSGGGVEAGVHDYTEDSTEAAKLNVTYSAGGRATKNTDPLPLGLRAGMSRGITKVAG